MDANKMNLMKSIMKRAAVIGCSAMLMLGSAIPAFAQGNDPAETTETTQDAQKTEVTEDAKENDVVTERVIGEDETTAFSVSGNAEVVDDITDGESKEFYTIRTANNNTFYLIVDRSATTDNVYMLSMIDENDLAEFLDETEDTSSTAVAIPENTVTEEAQTGEHQTNEDSTVEEESQTEETTSKGMNAGVLMALAILVIGGAGAAYYFKKVKPAQEAEKDTSEGMEYGENIRYEEDDDDTPDERTEKDEDSFEDDGLDENN